MVPKEPDEGRQGLRCSESMAPLCRGSCHGNAVTEGVYAIDMVKAIVRYSPTKFNRTPPPSALKGSHLPLHRGGKLKSTGAGPSEESPPLLERVAPKGAGVEGTFFV